MRDFGSGVIGLGFSRGVVTEQCHSRATWHILQHRELYNRHSTPILLLLSLSGTDICMKALPLRMRYSHQGISSDIIIQHREIQAHFAQHRCDDKSRKGNSLNNNLRSKSQEKMTLQYICISNHPHQSAACRSYRIRHICVCVHVYSNCLDTVHPSIQEPNKQNKTQECPNAV